MCVYIIGLHTLPFGTDNLEGDVRLVGSMVNGAGAVEIYTRIGWTSICPDASWIDANAQVICETLGYELGQAGT